MRKYRILVFPCGSEIGLEIHRSLCYSRHIELIGASSIDDHGKYVYSNYLDHIPYVDDINFIASLTDVVKKNQIDAVFPAMDKVIWKMKTHEKELGCLVISSPVKTTETCLSKSLTYKKLCNFVKTPITYEKCELIDNFPVFIKLDSGYGSRGVFKADNYQDLEYFLSKKCKSEYVISEFLSGTEYTVDCFTNRHRQLIFCGPRVRQRINSGISVNTMNVNNNLKEFYNIAETINNQLEMRGAWFFQLKRDKNSVLTLLEVAPRLGGSSSLFRGKGVNFALLSIFDAFGLDVEILENKYDIELDRALDNKYKMNINFSTVYVDFDDCIVIDGKINVRLISFLYECINQNKRIILITKHEKNIYTSLSRYKLNNFFDEIIHVSQTDNKIDYVTVLDSIFIDDSFQEREKVFKALKIPVFSPDMIECLIRVI